MPEYLVIGGDDESAVHAMAVAADLVNHVPGAQADIAVPAGQKTAAELGSNARRVVGFELAPSSVPNISVGAIKEAAGGGWKNLMSAARGKAKEAAAAATENFGQYRELREELRLARYDVVFDLYAGAGSVLVARSAAAVKVVGFAAENIPHAPPGLTLLYHENHPAPKNIPRREQCRMLAARTLGYECSPHPEWNFKPFSPPAWAPPPPFILLGGHIPAPFAEILSAAGAPLVGESPPAEAPPQPVSAGELLALAAAAACVVGGGLAAALGTAQKTPVFFIGGKQRMPPNAILTDSPAALKEALDGVLHAADSPPPPEISPKTDSAAEELPPPESSDISKESASPDSTAPDSGGLRIRKD